MRAYRIIGLGVLVAVATLVWYGVDRRSGIDAGVDGSEIADLVLRNGVIYTVDAERTVASAIAIKSGVILAVGSEAEVAPYIGPETRVRDLEGRFTMPGLHDAHVHALGIVAPDLCDLGGIGQSLEEIYEIVSECRDRYQPAPGEWLPVLQWDPFAGNEPSDRFPHIRAALDAAASDNPVILWANDGHHGAVNTAALNEPEVPINGETLKTTYADLQPFFSVGAEGEPTGVVSEHARYLMREPGDNYGLLRPSEKVMPAVAKMLAKSGITSIQDPAVGPHHLRHYLWMDRSGDMSFRVRTAFRIGVDSDLAAEDPAAAARQAIAKVNELREGAAGHSDRVQVNAIKLFIDGVLEGNPRNEPPVQPNAALLDGYLQPRFYLNDRGQMDVLGYVDVESPICQQVQANPQEFTAPGRAATFSQRHGFLPAMCLINHGNLVYSEELARHLVAEATRSGWHIHAHTIADHAVRLMADLFTEFAGAAKQGGLTQSLAHIQLAKPEDIKRLGALGAYVAATYLWAAPDMDYDMTVIPFIDPVEGRHDLYSHQHYYYQHAYPFRTFLTAGGHPVFGSDAPVGKRDPRPFENMYAALTRESEGQVLNEAERLDFDEVIRSYTLSGARLLGHEDRLGSLEVGKLADLIVLDRNIMDLAMSGHADQIQGTRVDLTLFEGKVVYDRDEND